jgi:ribosome-binding factor A
MECRASRKLYLRTEATTMSRRTERVNDLIREELSELLLREVRDPRLERLISITHVDVSPDFFNARVFVSIMGTARSKRTRCER